MMNDLFKDIINVILMVLRFTHKVCEVLKHLQENNLFCKPEKCKFFQSQVEYLDLIIGHNTIHMDKGKLAGVLDWPAPKKVKEIQAFLGFAPKFTWT
jgi:hypothetical protein